MISESQMQAFLLTASQEEVYAAGIAKNASIVRALESEVGRLKAGERVWQATKNTAVELHKAKNMIEDLRQQLAEGQAENERLHKESRLFKAAADPMKLDYKALNALRKGTGK